VMVVSPDDWMEGTKARLLEEAERILDDLNAEFGDRTKLCICCGSNSWDSYEGIIHTTDCLITKLREQIRIYCSL